MQGELDCCISLNHSLFLQLHRGARERSQGEGAIEGAREDEAGGRFEDGAQTCRADVRNVAISHCLTCLTLVSSLQKLVFDQILKIARASPDVNSQGFITFHFYS